MVAVLTTGRSLRQPRGAVRVDFANPLARSMIVAYCASAGKRNLVNGVDIAQVGTVSETLMRDGIAAVITPGATNGLTLGASGEYNPAAISVFALAELTTHSAGQEHMLITRDDNSLGRAFVLDITGASNRGCRWYVNGGGVVGTNELVEGTNPTTRRRYAVGATQAGASANLYVDGVLKATASSFTAKPSSTGATQIGRRTYSGFTSPLDGNLPLALIWSRELAPAEVIELCRAPWQLFKAIKPVLYSLPLFRSRYYYDMIGQSRLGS